jgi:hypothetical protein
MKKNFMTAFVVLLLVTITGLSQAAQKVITQYSNAAEGIGGGPPYISPIGDMGNPIVTDTGAITTTPTTINLGGNIYDAAGAVWYQGDSDLAYCTSGACNFGQGLRAFFNFQFTTIDGTNNSQGSADGFVFAIVNAPGNTDGTGIPNRTGGAPSQISIGELMGYAGPGTTADKLGIIPPKMGIEFDTFPNAANTNICDSNSRNDTPLGTNNQNFRNHIALMFWGDNLTGNCTASGMTSYPLTSFDDNRHTSGDNANFRPVNSSNPGRNTPNPSSGYYEDPGKPGGYNWFEDGQLHSFRIEIDRSTKADGTGNGLYTTRAWVDCNGTSCGTSQATHFQDVVNLFTDTPSQINRTVELSPADHQLMNRILFGLTEATGGATQIATITNFMIYFPKTPPACTYLLSASAPSPADFTAAGGTGTFSVFGCTTGPWTATATSSTPGWLTTTSSGTAPGSGNYTVAANNSTSRTGTISGSGIGQSFNVNQAAAPFNCTGGTETDLGGGHKRITFTTVGPSSLVCTGSGSVSAQVLIVAGGGGGGGGLTAIAYGGGGGGGGLLQGTLSLTARSYPVTVGAGGAGVLPNTRGNNGGNSVFSGTTTYTANGGGGGGARYNGTPNKTGQNGGSGGGGGGQYSGAGGSATQGSTSPLTGYGFNGAAGTATYVSGGGGGAGGAASGGTEGPGRTSSISGTSKTYAVGGNFGSGVTGAANTGNGGGGNAAPAGTYGSAGGSGIVIISY